MLEPLFDPSTIVVLLSVIGTFLTLVGFALPYLREDEIGLRVKAAAQRRKDLRTQQLEAMQKKSRLRKTTTNPINQLVEKFKLKELFAGQELRAKLIQANWRGPNAMAIFVSCRAGAPVVLGLVAALMIYGESIQVRQSFRLPLTFGGVLFGFYLPNILLQNAIQKRQQAFTLAFPDALDLLLICVESGLSIEAAFGRVAKEIGEKAPELAEEFELTTAELAYLPDRRVALENLTMRTGLPAVKAVVTTLAQAEKYGTPLTAALRNAAQENRDIRMNAAEKKAASLPATLTVPMIVFFLPVLFLVILGPVIIQISQR